MLEKAEWSLNVSKEKGFCLETFKGKLLYKKRNALNDYD